MFLTKKIESDLAKESFIYIIGISSIALLHGHNYLLTLIMLAL